jgi:hypothetical protein
MPQDLRVARPFTIVGSDSFRYTYGVAFYPQVSDAVADLPFVQWHTQEAVRARGGWCAQKRPLGGHLAMFWLDGNSAAAGEDIAPGYAPLFFDDPSLRHFPDLDRGNAPDFVQTSVDAAGEPLYRRVPDYDFVLNNMHSHLPRLAGVIRVFPGDPSPPVRGGGVRDRSMENCNDLKYLRPTPCLYTYLTPPPDTAPVIGLPSPPGPRVHGAPATPVPPVPDWARFTEAERPRRAKAVATSPRPPVPGMTPLEEMQRLYGPGWLQRAQS